MRNDELLQQFGESLGIHNLHLDIQRSCQLKIDDQFLVMITEIDEENLLINGIIGKLPTEVVESSAPTLLSINMLFAHIDGPYIAWEPQQDTLLLSKPVFTPEIDIYAFQEEINHIIQNVHHISETLHEKDIIVQEIEM